MKKLFSVLSLLFVVLLVGCSSEEKEKETVPVSYEGEFISYSSSEGVNYITIDNSGIPVTIMMSPDMVMDENILPGYIVSVSVLQYVDGTGEFATGISTLEVPLEVELGFTGDVLMSQEYDVMYQSLLAQVDYEYLKKVSGRLSSGKIYDSYYIDEDENVIYINIIGRVSIDDVETSWSSMEYIDRLSGDRYYLYNYGDWTHSTTDETSKITFSVPAESVIVDEFYREGANLVVKGSCSVVDGSYISYLLGQVLSGLKYEVSDYSVTFTAKFDEQTKQLFYAEYNVVFNGDVSDEEGGSVTVNKLSISLSGVDFNNTDTVSIPDYVKSWAPEESSAPVESGDVKLYQSLFGMAAEDVTDEWLSSMLNNPYENESITSVCNPDDVIAAARDIVLNYNLNQFMELSASDQMTVEQQFAVSALSYFLMEGVE